MNTELYNIVERVHISEKSTRISDKNKQIVFRVRTTATKDQIKSVVQKFFNVTVKSVQTVTVKGKHKTFKQRQGKQKNYKKAYVCLNEGQDIDFLGAD